jgi:hypothetical protein
MDVFLLNVMGSAAAASGIIAGIIATRMSREIAHACDSRPEPPGPERHRLSSTS